ncbi:hypothetical protein OF83DRAFT_1140766 [Amylostereum chailletii]|nr:hypothetical protein OF83DRAFT_1140766 [Amylostereum chailletii]
MVFDAVTIQSRFDAVGVKPFEIDIETEVKEAAVSRKFISSVYGGSSQGTFPTIAEERVAKHGIRSLMFASLDRHPNAPREAGLPGVWFLQEPLGKGNNKDSDGAPKDEENEEEFQAEDGGNNHDQNPSSVTPVKEPEEQKGRLTGHVSYTFVGLSPNQWRYLGQYELVEGEPLTQQEWILQTTRVRNAWAHALLRYDWGKRIRFSVIYRREHGTDPTEAQVQRADADENAYQDVTAEEIRQDFDLGKQQLGFFVMRCVGYDKVFARSIANAYAHWVDPSIKKPKKVEGKRKASASKGKEAATAKKRGRPSGGVKDDLREGDEAEEPVYVPRPTKSRSGRKGT